MTSSRVATLLGALNNGMSVFKFKHSSQYRRVSDDEHEARVMLGDDGARPYETPEAHSARRLPVFKILAVISSISVLWLLFRFAYWVFGSDAVVPTLENMPEYGALGCASAPYIYNNSAVTVTIPFSKNSAHHAFDVYGSIVGTFVLVEGTSDDTEVVYEMTLRANDPSLLDSVSFRYAEVEPDGTVLSSQFEVAAPGLAEDSNACLRYDIKMFVPPSLNTLHVATHAVTHLKFDPQSKIRLERFHATLFASSKQNLIVPHQSLQADTLGLEVFRGWIVGDVSITRSTSISTQRGDGVSSVRLHPLQPANFKNPETAALLTVTGSGKSDFTWVGASGIKRPIQADHKSSRNGDVYLDYRKANFEGLVALDSRRYEAKNILSITGDQGDKWTHWAGQKAGLDRLTVQSRGWTGLYL